MQNQTATSSASVASAIAKMLDINNVIVTKGAMRFNCSGNPEGATQIFGADFDAGLSVVAFKAINHMIAGTYTRVDGFMYFGSKIASLKEFKTANVLREAGDYVVGCDEMRALVAAGSIAYDRTVVDGGVYRLEQKGRMTIAHHLTATFREGFMSNSYSHDLNARQLIEALDTMYIAIERGKNITVMINKSGFVAEALVLALKSADVKAAIKANLHKVATTGKLNDAIEGALYVASHPELYAGSKLAEKTVKIGSVELSAKDLVGKTVNALRLGSETEMMYGANGIEVDSVEYAIALITASAKKGHKLVIVKTVK